MNSLLAWLAAPGWTPVVEALLHTLWQAGLAAALLALVFRRFTNPTVRYRCALGMLVLISLSMLITWAVLDQRGRTPPKAVGWSKLPAARAPSLEPPAPTGQPFVVVTTPAQYAEEAETTNWTGWLALTWLVGAGLMLLRAGVKIAGAERLRRYSRPLTDDGVIQLLEDAKRAVGYFRHVRLAATDRLTSPAVVGVLLPTLILPLSLLTTLTHEQIRFVLLHELAHIRRGDYFANLLQLLVESLLFFNPAVWWISHQVRREREACCDALAIACSNSPIEYARTLVQVAEQCLKPLGAAPAFGDEPARSATLVDRVQRLLVPGYRPALCWTWRATLISFMFGGTILFISALGTRTTVGAILADVKPVTTPAKPAPTDVVAPAGFGGPPRWVEPNPASATAEWTHARFAPKRRDSGYGPVVFDNSRPLSIVRSNRVRIPLLDEAELPNNLPSIGTHEVTLDQDVAFLAAYGSGDHPDSQGNGALLRIPIHEDTEKSSAPIEAKLLANSAVSSTVTGAGNTNDSASPTAFPSRQPVLTNHTQTAFLPSPARLTALQQLQRIRLKEVLYENAALLDVLRDLNQQAAKLDPDGKRVRFVLDSGKGQLTEVNSSLTKSHVEPVPDIGRVRINIRPALEDVTLSDLLDVLTQVAESRIHYSVEDFGVVFSANESAEPLYMREFKVDPIKFAQWLNLNLETRGENFSAPRVVVPSNSPSSSRVDKPAGLNPGSRTNLLSELHNTMKALFALANVDFHPPKHVFYKDRVGLLLVNATRSDFDKIEKLLAFINAEQPPQVNIKVRFVELDVRRHSLNWYFQNAAAGLTNLPASGSNSFSGILSESQFSGLMKSLENQNGVEFLQMPEVTTASGRQAQIQAVELRTIVNGLSNSATNGVTNAAFQTTTIPFGPVLDVVPYVAPDGVSIQLTLIPTITEFLGYDDPKEFTSKLPPEKRPKDQLPLPRMRVRQITTSAIVFDGQTIVLANFSDVIATHHPDGSETKRSNRSKNAKQLVVFITPTIVDPAGNRVHAAR